MNFLERLFGISVDGGDGSLEGLYLIAIVVFVTAVFAVRNQLAHRRR